MNISGDYFVSNMEASEGDLPLDRSVPSFSFHRGWSPEEQSDFGYGISTRNGSELNTADLFKGNSYKSTHKNLSLVPEDNMSGQDTAGKSKQNGSSRLSCASVAKLSDEKLELLPIQVLNKQFRQLPERLVQKFRKRRRILKNRKYALKCRKNNSAKEENIVRENKALELEIFKAKEELRKVVSERNDYKLKCAGLNAKLIAWRSKQGNDAV